MRPALLIGSFILLGASPAVAKEWVVDESHSHLGFIGMQGSSSFEGSFGKFEPHIDLDPDKPEGGKITVSIDMTSASAGSSERDDYLPQADWFDTKQFPKAQFTSSSIRKTGDHAYIAEGHLTIKGVEQPLTLPFTLTPEGDHWRAQGKTTLLRSAFHIGIGQWANENYVKYAVDVLVDITAKPAP